jgi:hypothetical protein
MRQWLVEVVNLEWAKQSYAIASCEASAIRSQDLFQGDVELAANAALEMVRLLTNQKSSRY